MSNPQVMFRDDPDGAVDMDACRSRKLASCYCEKCTLCGFGKHMAIHGPVNGGAPGSKPYGHRFRSPAEGDSHATQNQNSR